MTKNYKKFLVFTLLTIVVIAGIYWYIMNAGARNIETEKANFNVTTTAFSKEFTLDGSAANKKYLNKAISITGTITDINVKENLVILDEITICQFQKANNHLQKGIKITIKGRFTGFDDLMGELKLDQCVILK